MEKHTLREDLDQLTDEWRAHRGAEVALLRGQQQITERVNELHRQVVALGDFTEELERRLKSLSCQDHRFGDRGICFTCGQPRAATQVPS